MVKWVSLGGSDGAKVPVPGVELKIGTEQPAEPIANVPALGANTTQVLELLGYDRDTIASLFTDSIVQ
jgi:crotonobetainyl-CoA:carnitine CoA-transferase CaiB-like acyl-CoA transferase